jgi:hypothetical protein
MKVTPSLSYKLHPLQLVAQPDFRVQVAAAVPRVAQAAGLLLQTPVVK